MKKIMFGLLMVAIIGCSGINGVKQGRFIMMGQSTKIIDLVSSLAGSSGVITWDIVTVPNDEKKYYRATITRKEDYVKVVFTHQIDDIYTLVDASKNGYGLSLLTLASEAYIGSMK